MKQKICAVLLALLCVPALPAYTGKPLPDAEPPYIAASEAYGSFTVYACGLPQGKRLITRQGPLPVGGAEQFALPAVPGAPAGYRCRSITVNGAQYSPQQFARSYAAAAWEVCAGETVVEYNYASCGTLYRAGDGAFADGSALYAADYGETPPCPSRSGYVFCGWRPQSGGAELPPAVQNAVWKIDEADTKPYTVLYYINGCLYRRYAYAGSAARAVPTVFSVPPLPAAGGMAAGCVPALPYTLQQDGEVLRVFYFTQPPAAAPAFSHGVSADLTPYLPQSRTLLPLWALWAAACAPL